MKPPAFQLYADDFLAGTMTMTNEEVGAYFRLLCIQWSAGCIRDKDVDRICRMTIGGEPMAQPSVCHVVSKFVRSPDDTLRNARLEYERAKQVEFRENRSKSGRKGAEARWKDGTANGSAMAQPLANTMANDSSPSPSPSPSTKKEGQVEMEIAVDPAEIPKELHSPEFSAAWQRWMTFRRGLGKKPKNWAILFSEQLVWLKQFGPVEATEMISQSIRNGYQGIFERKNGTNQQSGKPSTDRNAGTANAGKASQYRGLGKVVGL